LPAGLCELGSDGGLPLLEIRQEPLPLLTLAALRMEPTMLTALVLICSVAVTPDLRDCTRDNATAVMRAPAEFGNPATCFMHGQAYLAQTSIGQEIGDYNRVKIVCTPSQTVDRSIRRATVK
jgi:hypothetical protein